MHWNICRKLIENVFHLTYRENTGAAFSILRDNVDLLIGLTGIVILVMAYIFFYLIKEKSHWLILVSISFMFGGAIGNFIDRFRLGYVIDYFDFRLINFAVFNGFFYCNWSYFDGYLYIVY